MATDQSSAEVKFLELENEHKHHIAVMRDLHDKMKKSNAIKKLNKVIKKEKKKVDKKEKKIAKKQAKKEAKK